MGACPTDPLTQEPLGNDPGTTAAPDAGVVVRDAGSSEMAALVPQPVTPVAVHDARRGPPYPILLAHGLNGFRDLGPVEYFFNVPGALTDAGEEVYVTAVAPYDGSPQRARALATQVDQVLRESGARKLNIIAHSQGGVDSRYLISTLGYGDRVASLTTISTPHRGTRVADLLRGGGSVVTTPIINAWAWLFGEASADTQNNPNARAAMDTLSTDEMARFNEQNPDDPRVQYFSFAGRSNLQKADDLCNQAERPNPDAIDAVEAALLPTWLYLAEDILHPTPNDGLVTVESARWGRFMGCLPADHGDEIGQLLDLIPDITSGWDHVAFYTDWVTQLRQWGL
jgi:triacylglycerol lipase